MGSILKLAENISPLCVCIHSKSDTYIHHTPRYNSDRGITNAHTGWILFQLIGDVE